MLDLSSPDNLVRLFQPRLNDRLTISIWCEALAYCISKNIIRVRKEKYAKIPVPEKQQFAEASVYVWAGRGKQGLRHHLLKWYAWNWHVKTFHEAPQFERGGIMDLYGKESRVWIECGSAEPIRAFDYFFGKGIGTEAYEQCIKQFVLFPFDHRLPMTEQSCAFVFEPSDSGREILPEYAKWKEEHARWEAEERAGRHRPRPETPDEPYNLGRKYPPENLLIYISEDNWRHVSFY